MFEIMVTTLSGIGIFLTWKVSSLNRELNSHKQERDVLLSQLEQRLESKPDLSLPLVISDTPLTREGAISAHEEVLKQVLDYPYYTISPMYHFASGTLSGWFRSGLITQDDFHRMDYELTHEVIGRLRELKKQAGE
ncbi:hypothetical protein THF1C08_50148 [Vibrio jasicida]|uniref:Uncharacterized protein n=1 Tax=Vibrio jasicida TaxID=766224 RepID=A0AAU9QTI5_9VIBR|nr:hypothetical protein THF1C08_50148 [Vibrio jasicida]CAH1601751.1 hypothetical protein THF1A12_50199 [Vibrio jasicida]